MGIARLCFAAVLGILVAQTSSGQAFGLAQLSEESKLCIGCHKSENATLYQQWGQSLHFRANVSCYECHLANEGDVDGFDHYGQRVSVLVTPRDCARCHAGVVEEFSASRHSKGGLILGSLDNRLAEVVEGDTGMVTPMFPHGVSASAVSGCWQCHGSEVKMQDNGKPDPATWPNNGIGRINPDGSEGSCTSCHFRHSFSIEQARHPNTCGTCHLGPDHPQREIYEASRHGVAFEANRDDMNLDAPKWVPGQDYWAAPTCSTCHMSATARQPVTHDVGLRISWNNRPEVSIRPEVADAAMDLPGASIPWNVRRQNMKDVCMGCHSKQWVDGFYTQYDELIELYNTKFGQPGKDLYELAKPLFESETFGQELDWIWFELWHHEGRSARHGAAMMAPDYTHWHGMYEVAKTFYNEYIPRLQQLASESSQSDDADRAEAARALQAKIDEVLSSEAHRWYLKRAAPGQDQGTGE
ncbi:MAG: multiheme c-type cytochrome [Planctomycetota bacterium]|jgi:hypothetical protein